MTRRLKDSKLYKERWVRCRTAQDWTQSLAFAARTAAADTTGRSTTPALIDCSRLTAVIQG